MKSTCLVVEDRRAFTVVQKPALLAGPKYITPWKMQEYNQRSLYVLRSYIGLARKLIVKSYGSQYITSKILVPEGEIVFNKSTTKYVDLRPENSG